LLFAEDMLTDSDLELFLMVYEHLYQGYQLPDLALYLDVPPKVCLARAANRREQDPGRAFEKGLTLERLARMRTRYQSRLPQLGREVVTVDLTGAENQDEVVGQVAQIIEARLRKAHNTPSGSDPPR
jgi:thymidylate kinase